MAVRELVTVGTLIEEQKNFSVLLRGSQVRLAPLYDLNSVTTYLDSFYLPKEKMAMKIGNEYVAHKITARHWRALANEIGVDPDFVLGRAEEMCDGVAGALQKAGEEFASVSPTSSMPERLHEAIVEQVVVCKRLLAS